MSSGTVWLVIALAALTTVVTKGVGPAATGSRELPAPAVRVVVLLAAPLLTALVVTNALADGQELRVGADTAGAVAAALLVWRRAHVVVVVVVAAAVTALLRALG
ncbi:MAG: AzlD domain-containing protein [Actinomycetes bacterium]